MKLILFKPFEKYTERTLLIAGICFTIIGSFAAYIMNSRFDGVLDFHSTPEQSLKQPFIDNLINIFSLTIFLYAAAKYINKKTRIIDILTASIIARTPLYILPFFNLRNVINNLGQDIIEAVKTNTIDQIPAANVIIVTAFGLIAMVFLIWYIILLFNCFKVASNAKGIVPIILFVVAILLAEASSKYLIFLVN